MLFAIVHEDLTQERTRYIYNLLQLNKRMMSYCISYHLSLSPSPLSLLSLSLSPLSLPLSLPSLSLSLPLSPPLSLSPPLPPLSLSTLSLSLSLSLSSESGQEETKTAEPGEHPQQCEHRHQLLLRESISTAEAPDPLTFPFYTQKNI